MNRCGVISLKSVVLYSICWKAITIDTEIKTSNRIQYAKRQLRRDTNMSTTTTAPLPTTTIRRKRRRMGVKGNGFEWGRQCLPFERAYMHGEVERERENERTKLCWKLNTLFVGASKGKITYLWCYVHDMYMRKVKKHYEWTFTTFIRLFSFPIFFIVRMAKKWFIE